VALLRRRIQLDPETDNARVPLARCYGHLGREEEARNTWREVVGINPHYSIDNKGTNPSVDGPLVHSGQVGLCDIFFKY
jgi:hypothetical protein